jgi:hypothetical protein
MARIDGNDLTLRLKGKFGKQFVFRKFKNRTVALRAFEPNRTKTEAQLEHRERFRLATLYAKRCMLIPELKAEYEMIARATDNSSAFATAIADFLKPVTIEEVLTASYNGQSGFPLSIMVSSVFKVKTMTVTITNANGTVVESGNASIMAGSSGFSYVTTVELSAIAGVKINVTVTDRPGNTVTHDVPL